MSKTRKRTKLLRAFYRLPVRDKMVLLGLFAGAVGVLVFGMFKMTNTGLVTGFNTYPSSSFVKSGKIGTRKVLTSKDLDTMVVYPGTHEAVFVGGEPLPPCDFGQAFRYSDDITLFVAVGDKASSTIDTASNSFPRILGGETAEGEYREQIAEKGYMNTLPATYSGGYLRTADNIYYILVYRYELDDKSIFLGASTTDSFYLNEAGNLLDKVFYTMIEVEEKDDAEIAKDSAGGESMSHRAVDGKSAEEALLLMREDREHVQSRIGNVDSADSLQKDLSVDTDGESVAFLFSYTNGDSTPSSAVLKTPGGKLLAPNDNNSDHSGNISFIVDKTEQGIYHMSISNDIDFGYYTFSLMDLDEYNKYKNK